MASQNVPLSSGRTNTSKAAISGLNLNLKPIDEYIFEGFQKQFLRIFEARSVWVSSTDKLPALKRLFEDGAKSCPYAFFTLNSWTESTERGNNTESARRGRLVALSDDQIRGFRMHSLAVDFAVTVEFVTNDYREILRYARRWLMARRRGHFNFDVAYGLSHFGISVVPSESITFPQKEGDAENIPEYVATADLIIRGHISDETVVEQQIKDTVQITGLLKEEPKPGTEVWRFRRSAVRPEMNENVESESNES